MAACEAQHQNTVYPQFFFFRARLCAYERAVGPIFSYSGKFKKTGGERPDVQEAALAN